MPIAFHMLLNCWPPVSSTGIEPCTSPSLPPTDLLACHCMPEWPAASTLLLRLTNALAGPLGLQHTEHSPRQVSTDLLGLLLAELWRQAGTVEGDATWVRDTLAAHGALV